MFLVAGARASVITYTHTTPSATVPFTDNFAFPQFDPTTGTLTSVSIGATVNVVAQISVFNGLATTQSFTNASAAIPVTISAPAGLVLSLTPTAGPLNSTANIGFNNYPGIPGTATGNTSPANFSPYLGTNLFGVAMSFAAGLGTYSGSGPIGLFFGGTADGGGVTTLTYTYTPNAVPEPATIGMTLAGLGFVGFGIFRRRRR
jgi:hypothetical protein